MMVNSNTQLSPSALSIRFDDLSSTLVALILLSVFLNSFVKRNNYALIHPMILGRQAEMARVRHKSETPLITNSGSLPGMLPSSPQRSITSLHKLILASEGKLSIVDIETCVPPDVSFRNLVSKARNHLWSALASTDSQTHTGHPRLLILCSDPYLRLVLSLAAATLPLVTLLGSSSRSRSVPVQVQQACKTYLAHISLVMSDMTIDDTRELLGAECEANIILADHISGWFKASEESAAPDDGADLQRARLLMIGSRAPPTDNQTDARVFSFTPDNLLAGITASLGLFPMTARLATKDRIALQSDHASAWGHEASLAVAALFTGAQVCFFDHLKHVVEWHPTVLAVKPSTVQNLADQIIRYSHRSVINKLAIGRRLSTLTNGALLSPLASATEWVGPALKSILTDGPVTQSSASLVRAGLGASLQRVYTHPVAAGPILASHPYDFQMLQPLQAAIHCGPPSVNVECKIIDVPEPSMVISDAAKGKLLVRGPSVGVELTDGTQNSESKGQPEDSFYTVEENAELQPNGTIRIHSCLPWDY